ncbi:FAD-binding protein [Ensifer canadensis]
MPSLHPEFKGEVRKTVGEGNLKDGEAVSTIDHEVAPKDLGAGAAVLPRSTEEVADVVKCCLANGVALVTYGGRTGLVGGAMS